jgi:hypothetical protein
VAKQKAQGTKGKKKAAKKAAAPSRRRKRAASRSHSRRQKKAAARRPLGGKVGTKKSRRCILFEVVYTTSYVAFCKQFVL